MTLAAATASRLAEFMAASPETLGLILLEDETGLTNVIIRPDLYAAERSVVRGELYLCIEGVIRFSCACAPA